jgi:hypothetical protein
MRSPSRRGSRNRSAQSPGNWNRGRESVPKRKPAKRNKRPTPKVGNRSPNGRRQSRLAISDTRLERALRVLSETGDVGTAARSIRVAMDRFKRTALRKGAIRKSGLQWIVARRLPRKMPIFSGGRQLAITVNSRAASLIGRYMATVGQFLKTNNPKFLAEFTGRDVKDAHGKIHQFETDPNTLYRLSSAGGEPFEEMYRIVI